MRSLPVRLLLAVILTAGIALSQLSAQTEAPSLTKDQVRAFLLNAKIVQGKQVGKGVTHPYRLTLNDGTITHDAVFQSIDEHRTAKQFDNAKSEMNFVDSYHYNIAAYNIAELLGLDSMMPMYVERRWQGKMGSVGWWVEATMDEGQRLKEAKKPPDTDAWNKQMYRMRLFSQLVYDVDRNLTNVLVTDQWKVWMIDFTRAFRLWPDLASTKDLTKCDRQLLQTLRALTEETVEASTKPHLSKSEIRAMMTRRDKLVAHFDQLIAEKGEAEVLY